VDRVGWFWLVLVGFVLALTYEHVSLHVQLAQLRQTAKPGRNGPSQVAVGHEKCLQSAKAADTGRQWASSETIPSSIFTQ